MANTPNYGWPTPNPTGIQITEIQKIATALTAADQKVNSVETALSTHKHSFSDLENLPDTLAGYGITNGATIDEMIAAIQQLKNELVNGSGPALDTLKELADALGNDPNFATTVGTALGQRVRVDTGNSFTLAQKAQGRTNLDALGTVDKGVANGVASLDSTGKVPSAQLPGLTTTETVGAAVAGANGGDSIADGDTLTGVLSGTSSLRRWTWGNIKAWLKAYFDPIYQKSLGFVPVRQGGFSGATTSTVSIGWGTGNLVLNVDASNFGANWPISITGRANGGASWADGAAYANTLGNGGWSLATIQDQLNWRVTDSRFAGYFEQNFNVAATSWGEVVPGASGYIVTAVWTWAPKNMTFAWRQPQIYVPNVGWRAFGGW